MYPASNTLEGTFLVTSLIGHACKFYMESLLVLLTLTVNSSSEFHSGRQGLCFDATWVMGGYIAYFLISYFISEYLLLPA